jgi:hypothetical protein
MENNSNIKNAKSAVVNEPQDLTLGQTEAKLADNRLKDFDGDDDVETLVTDGILSYEGIRRTIFDLYGTTIAKDDPILMILPMLQVFCRVLQDLQNNHKKKLNKVLAQETEKYIKEVIDITQSLSKLLENATIKSIEEIFNKYSNSLNEHKSYLKYSTLIIIVTVITNLVIYFIKA